MGPETGTPSDRFTRNHSYSTRSRCSSLGVCRVRRCASALSESELAKKRSSWALWALMSYRVDMPTLYSCISARLLSPFSRRRQMSIFSFRVSTTLLRFSPGPRPATGLEAMRRGSSQPRGSHLGRGWWPSRLFLPNPHLPKLTQGQHKPGPLLSSSLQLQQLPDPLCRGTSVSHPGRPHGWTSGLLCRDGGRDSPQTRTRE